RVRNLSRRMSFAMGGPSNPAPTRRVGVFQHAVLPFGESDRKPVHADETPAFGRDGAIPHQPLFGPLDRLAPQIADRFGRTGGQYVPPHELPGPDSPRQRLGRLEPVFLQLAYVPARPHDGQAGEIR